MLRKFAAPPKAEFRININVAGKLILVKVSFAPKAEFPIVVMPLGILTEPAQPKPLVTTASLIVTDPLMLQLIVDCPAALAACGAVRALITSANPAIVASVDLKFVDTCPDLLIASG